MELTPNQVVSTNLRRIRERNGLTQKTVAKLLGWSEESYAQAERAAKGRRVRRFDADELYTLARALDTTVPALLLPPPGATIARDGSSEPPTELAQRVLLLDEGAQANLAELLESLPSEGRRQLQGVLEIRIADTTRAEFRRLIDTAAKAQRHTASLHTHLTLLAAETPYAYTAKATP